ncbi:uncharacterized protein UV8b_05321 [Ustilaginoidea virens]|uniref:Uncharacterized protein n=1 Tax=Ustilaginoidea virens TaxID=1159556 RepID=A0A8E5MHZ8_USTVR|nr:uncharacterized protein UV8b_05321 [Ustilaginoidea virens]QUC21078.1 hypothetical protein UV8b_05321 [Ustilaginoidea virens]
MGPSQHRRAGRFFGDSLFSHPASFSPSRVTETPTAILCRSSSVIDPNPHRPLQTVGVTQKCLILVTSANFLQTLRDDSVGGDL